MPRMVQEISNKIYLTKVQLGIFFLLLFSIHKVWAVGPAEAFITNLGDTTHLEFQGLPNWNYDVQKKTEGGKTSFHILVPRLTAQSRSSLSEFESPLVQDIEVKTGGADGRDILILTVTDANTEAFDYLTEKPSRLIVDIFQQQGARASDKKSAAASVKTSNKLPVKKIDGKKEGDSRKPANDVLVINPEGQVDVGFDSNKQTSGVFDGGDPNFDRFSIKDYEVKEDAIIAAREKVYLEFPMVEVPSPYFEILQTKKPIYEVLPENTDENKQARLLTTLFENKRYNVFLKTAEWFSKKFPNSQYDEMIKFMTADAHFANWMDAKNAEDFDIAMLKYRQALEAYPQSDLAERTMMLTGFASLDRGDYLGTLRQFQSHIAKRPKSPNRDIARFAIAEAYLKLRRYDEALQAYGDIEKDGSQDKYRIEAQYRRGDVAYQRGDFRGAIAEYQEAIKKYPNDSKNFPNALYNQAAAYFKIKDYRKALELDREFLKKFPSHPHAGYAMTRVGELLEILGADPTRVMGAYLETYFRYGDTPSSVVARLRMLSERMNTMKPKEVEKAIKDIAALSKDSKLKDIDQFATLLIAEGHSKRKEFDKAIGLLTDYYQKNPTTADTKLLTNRIVKNINEQISNAVQQRKFIEALQIHNKYADGWLKSSDRIDTKFNIGQAYEQAGANSDAEKLYRTVLNQVYSLKGTQDQKERNIFEKLPTEDALNLRLAAVTNREQKYAESFDFLKAIKKPEALPDVEQIERVQLAASLLERRGETDSAVRYLSELLKAWSGLPELVAEPYLDLAQLEVRQKKENDALTSLEKVDQLMKDSGKVSEMTHSKALEMMGHLYVQKGEVDKALKSYEDLLRLYEKKRPLSYYRYQVGRIYFQKGEIQKAAEVWNDLKSEKNDIWYRLSQEQLRNSEFNNEYKKYIQRIPAMNGAGEIK